MGKALNFYESLFVVNLTRGDDAVADVVDRFTNLIAENGQIIDIAKWGKRRLAYPINDLNEGYYVVVTFKSQPAFINELERLLNINEMILRSMTIRLPYDAEAKFKARAAKAVANEPPAEVAADSAAEVAADSNAEEEPGESSNETAEPEADAGDEAEANEE